MFKLSKRAIAIRNVITTSVIILIGIMVLVGIWYHFHRMKPVKNRHPTKFITLHGHIDKGLQVKLSAYYQTTNPSCQYYASFAEGALAPRYKEVIVKAQPDHKGDYEVKLPLDAFESGYCRWKVNSIVYYVDVYNKKVDEDTNWIVGFDYKKHKTTTLNPKTIYNCSVEGGVQMACGLPVQNFDPTISSKTKFLRVDFNLDKGKKNG